MITAAERAGAMQGTSTRLKMPLSELVAFFIKEAQHQVIDNEHRKSAETWQEGQKRSKAKTTV